VSGSSSTPPASRLPRFLQGLRFARDPLGVLIDLRNHYGDVFSVNFPFFGRVTYVADPELVKRVFTGRPELMHAGEANATVLEASLGPYSLLTLDEGEHMRQRKLLLPPFHGERVRRYGELIREITERDLETWPVGESFAVRPHMTRITLSVILRTAFGVRDEERSRRAFAAIGEFARRATTITELPFLRYDFGRISPWRRFLAARDGLDDFVYGEIAARRAEPDADERDDVLSMLLRATHDDGTPMSDRELRDELVTIIGAGHETTATALTWALERLVRTPRALERLRESVAGGDDAYVDATIKETLRARPVVMDVARKLTAPTRLGDYELPAGAFVLPAIAALHYREDLFPNPREFRPERFLDEDVESYAWIPFGGGVRRCIGAAFAEYEMRVVLKAIIERAAISAAEPAPERVKIRNITLAPARDGRIVLDRPLAPAPAPAASEAAQLAAARV
jgi:cytochrome P450